jgi:hypothetical protein
MPVPTLQKFTMAIEEEFPIYKEYLGVSRVPQSWPLYSLKTTALGLIEASSLILAIKHPSTYVQSTAVSAPMDFNHVPAGDPHVQLFIPCIQL